MIVVVCYVYATKPKIINYKLYEIGGWGVKFMLQNFIMMATKKQIIYYSMIYPIYLQSVNVHNYPTSCCDLRLLKTYMHTKLVFFLFAFQKP